MAKQVNLFTGEVTEVDTSKKKIYIDGFDEPMTIDEAIKKGNEGLERQEEGKGKDNG